MSYKCLTADHIALSPAVFCLQCPLGRIAQDCSSAERDGTIPRRDKEAAGGMSCGPGNLMVLLNKRGRNLGQALIALIGSSASPKKSKALTTLGTGELGLFIGGLAQDLHQ